MLRYAVGCVTACNSCCCCVLACRQLQRQRRVIESSNLFADVQREYILNQLEVNVAAGAAQAAEELFNRTKRAARCVLLSHANQMVVRRMPNTLCNSSV